MLEVADPQVLAALRPLLIPSFLLWGALWSLVALHYGAAAHFSWREQGGRWNRAVGDLTRPVIWAARQLARDLGLSRPKPLPARIPHVYSPGHILRFAVFMGSLAPAVFGFYFWGVSRQGWTWLDLAVCVSTIWLSVVAAMGHLFLAYRAKPAAWRNLIVGVTLWMVLVPGVMYASGV